MAKVHNCQGYMSASASLGGGSDRYGVWGSSVPDDMWQTSAGAAFVLQTIRSGMTVKNARVFMSANTWDGDAILTLQKNGSDTAISITITNSTTGEFVDDTNEVSFSSGDTIRWKLDLSTNITSGSGKLRIIDSISEYSSNAVTRLTSCDVTTFAGLTNNTTYYTGIAGSFRFGDSTNEAYYQIVSGTAGTLKNFGIRVTINNRTSDTIFRVRINGADGNISITVPGGSTGYFEDTTNTDTISAGDLVNLSFTAGASGSSMGVFVTGIDFETTNKKSLTAFVGGQWATPFDAYASIGGFGATPDTTENNIESRVKFSCTVSYLSFYISASNINPIDGTPSVKWIVRKNNANTTLLKEATNNATGRFTETSLTDDLADGDNINFKQDTNAAGIFDSLVIRNACFTIEDTTVTASSTRLRMLMGYGL